MKITTWNINSVRLRIAQVVRFLGEEAPDVLCLQETKCRDDQFPEKEIRAAGYEHIALNGQAGGYHGVATVSRVPFTGAEARQFCGKEDGRHICVDLDPGAALGDARGKPVSVHNFYVPAGGDEPDREANEKFDHKLNFMEEMTGWFGAMKAKKSSRLVLVGDLNVAPGEHDVWSHKQLLKVVSHTPVEVEHLERVRAAHQFTDVARAIIPEDEKLYSWWSYRARDWRASNRGRRLDHIWASPALEAAATAPGRKAYTIHDRCRGWEKPSDHAPVTVAFDPSALG